MPAGYFRGRRTRWVSAAVLAVLSVPLSLLAKSEEARSELRRVRATNARLERALDEGVERSATLRDLVDRLELSDLIVHITPRLSSGGIYGGETNLTAAIAGSRYLRISIQQDLPRPQLIAMIGHELQHAVEVADAPQVVDSASFRALYLSIGFSREPGRHETVAAQQAGERVLRELSRR